MMIEFYVISQKIELALKQAQDMYEKAQVLATMTVCAKHAYA